MKRKFFPKKLSVTFSSINMSEEILYYGISLITGIDYELCVSIYKFRYRRRFFSTKYFKFWFWDSKSGKHNTITKRETRTGAYQHPIGATAWHDCPWYESNLAKSVVLLTLAKAETFNHRHGKTSVIVYLSTAESDLVCFISPVEIWWGSNPRKTWTRSGPYYNLKNTLFECFNVSHFLLKGNIM